MKGTELTLRQRNVLTFLIKEYISTGQAVSSLGLDRKYKLPVSTATIRNDFATLTQKGYLYKEYSSSGRVPTDKAWKWFVQAVLKDNENLSHLSLALDKIFLRYRQRINQSNRTLAVKDLLDDLVKRNHFFCFYYLSQEDRIYEDGLEYIFRDIAQEKRISLEVIRPLVQSVDELRERLRNVKISQRLAVFIGRENPLIPSDEFSTIIASLPSYSAFIGVIGTKRMPYDKHIALLRRVSSMFSDNINKPEK